MSGNPLLFFDAIFVLNLAQRTDRLSKWRKEAERIGLRHPNLVIFSAINGYELDTTGWLKGPGALGCLESHLAILRVSKKEGYKRVLIFEDDFLFHKKFNKLLAQGLNELPAAWDMLYLYSCHIEKQHSFSRHLDKMACSLGTVAYAVHAGVMDTLIQALEKKERQVDVVFGSMHKQLACYSFKKNLCITYDVYSDIEQKVVTGSNRSLWHRCQSAVYNVKQLLKSLLHNESKRFS